MITFFWLALFAGILSFIFVYPVSWLAYRTDAVDRPRPPRHLHGRVVPKLGGLAVYLSITIVTLLWMWFGDLNSAVLSPRFLYGLLAGGFILCLGGFLDDRYDLPPRYLWLFPAAATIVALASGIGVGITTLTHPFGGTIDISRLLFGYSAIWPILFFWFMGMMFTTKFLDGLDGLVAGVGTISALSLFAVSLTEKVNQPSTASVAIILVGALFGYVLQAWHPARIFFGEGGSTLVGFFLAGLSVLVGAKIATAFLVMGVPILDVAWVIFHRLRSGRSPFQGDRSHLHFRLLEIGLSHRQAVLAIYALSAAFGLTAVTLQSYGKFISILLLCALVFSILIGLQIFIHRRGVDARAKK